MNLAGIQINTRAAAQIIGVDYWVLDQMTRKGEGPSFTKGPAKSSNKYFDLAEVVAYAEGQKETPP